MFSPSMSGKLWVKWLVYCKSRRTCREPHTKYGVHCPKMCVIQLMEEDEGEFPGP